MTGLGSLVLVDRRDDVAIVTLNRPEVRNALNLALARELASSVQSLAQDPQLRAVVVTGVGDRAFCAGADLVERRDMSPDQRRETTEAIFAACQAIAAMPVPVIAAVRGYCLAGGAELAIACDLRVASEDAVFGWSEVKVGVFPGAGGAVRLPRLVGLGAARDLLYTGRRIDAGEAHRIGLVDRLAPPVRTLDDALTLAAEIASAAPLAVRALKQALREADGLSEAAAHEAIARHRRPLDATADYAEGLRAFSEKRAPEFHGR